MVDSEDRTSMGNNQDLPILYASKHAVEETEDKGSLEAEFTPSSSPSRSRSSSPTDSQNNNNTHTGTTNPTGSKSTTPTTSATTKELPKGKLKKPNAKSKKPKPEGHPKRPLSAYNFFFQIVRDRLVEGDESLVFTQYEVDGTRCEAREDPKKRAHRRTHGKIGFKELAYTIGGKWRALDPYYKNMFSRRALVDRQRYDREMLVWRRSGRIEGGQGLSVVAPSSRDMMTMTESPSPSLSSEPRTELASSPIAENELDDIHAAGEESLLSTLSRAFHCSEDENGDHAQPLADHAAPLPIDEDSPPCSMDRRDDYPMHFSPASKWNHHQQQQHPHIYPFYSPYRAAFLPPYANVRRHPVSPPQLYRPMEECYGRPYPEMDHHKLAAHAAYRDSPHWQQRRLWYGAASF